MSRQKILIISNGPLCRNPRVYKEAVTLGHAGYDVTVLTVRNHAPSEAHDAVLLKDALFRRITVDMLPGFSTPRIRVFSRRVGLWAARKLARFSALRSIHSLGPATALLQEARRQEAGLTIVHNEIAHWVGLRLMEDGRPVAADIEDWHSEDLLPADRERRPLTILRQVERTLLQRAVYTTTTSQALAAALHTRYGGRQPVVLSNSFPLQPKIRAKEAGHIPAFFWFSQTLGPGRGLEPFLAAWMRMCQPSRLVLLGESAQGFVQKLRASVPDTCQARLELLDLVPTDELPDVIARHDIGLALELADIPNRDLTITNKILQYLNAGLAIIATDTRGQREVLACNPAAGILVSLDDPESLARRLDEFIADRVSLVARQQAARQLAVSHYCWEQEAPKLTTLVAGALAGTKPNQNQK